MKKVFCGLLILLVVITSIPAMAESWDYDQFFRYPDKHIGSIVDLEGWVYTVYKNKDGLFEMTITIGSSWAVDKTVALRCKSDFTPKFGDYIKIRARYAGQDTLGSTQTMGFIGVSNLELFKGSYTVDFGWGLTEDVSYEALKIGSHKGATMSLQGRVIDVYVVDTIVFLGIVDALGNEFILYGQRTAALENSAGCTVIADTAKCEGYVKEDTHGWGKYLGVPAFSKQYITVIPSSENSGPSDLSSLPIPAEIFIKSSGLSDDVAEVLSGVSGFAWEYDEMTGLFIMSPSGDTDTYVSEGTIVYPALVYFDDVLRFDIYMGSERKAGEELTGMIFLVDGVRYNLTRPILFEMGVYGLVVGKSGAALIKAIVESSDQVKVRLSYSSGNIDFTMSDAQIETVETLFTAYESIGALNQETLGEYDLLCPITIK